MRYLYLKYQLYIAIISLNSSKQIPRPKYLKHSGDKARNLPMRIWLPNLANLPPWFRTTLRILQNKNGIFTQTRVLPCSSSTLVEKEKNTIGIKTVGFQLKKKKVLKPKV